MIIDEILYPAEDNYNSSFVCNEKTLCTCFQGLSEQAVNAFRVMRSDGLRPSILALNSLINAFGEDRRDAEAFAVLQYMKDNVSEFFNSYLVK